MVRGAVLALFIFNPIVGCRGQEVVQEASAEDLLERLKTEAPRKWKQYCEMMIALGWRAYDLTDIYPGALGITETRTADGHRYRRCWLDISRRITFKPYLDKIAPEAIDQEGTVAEEHVRCSNPRYYFELDRKSPRMPWQVAVLYSANLNAEEYAAHVGHPERVRPLELRFGTEYLPELLSKPGFVIEGITEEGSYVRVRFTYDPGANEAWNTVVSGSFGLDPEYYWLVVDATLEHVTAVSRRPSFTQVLRIEYGKEMVGGLRSPIVTTSERKSAVVAAQNFTNRTARYLYETDSYRRESDYTLASFGVAEPEWARRSTPWYWYALIAGIFAVVAVLLWWRWQSALSRSRS